MTAQTRKEVTALFWQQGPGGTVTCHLCPHLCHLKPDEMGLCGVRQNQAGRLVALAYGKLTALGLDPIEKKPLAGFMPGSTIFSVGSYGCNFRCPFCQNYHLSQRQADWQYVTPEDLLERAVLLKSRGNCGIAFTYNEPLINFEYLLDTAKLIHKAGLFTVLVSNGYINAKPLSLLLPWIAACNIDLKAWNPAFYQNYCAARLTPVKETIKQAAKSCHVEITCLLIPGLNDAKQDIEQMAAWLAEIDPGIILHLSRHHPDYKMSKPQPISRSRLEKLSKIASKHLKKVYLGNVW